MPPKVSKVSSKPTQTKTIAKASTSSSSKSSRSSKASSSSGVKKSAPPVTSKPRNVDKVDFGKTKTTADAGIYKPAPPPKSMAAAKHEDPITEMHNKKMRELEDKMLSPAGKKVVDMLRNPKDPHGPQIPNTKIVAPSKPKPAPDDYNPMKMDLKTRAAINEIGHQYDKEHPRQTLHDVENAVSIGPEYRREKWSRELLRRQVQMVLWAT